MSTPPQIQNISIRNEAELRKLLVSFMPEDNGQARKTLIDSFNVVRARTEASQKLQKIDPDDFGGYEPAPLKIYESFPSLDSFIRKRMGGERDGLRIKWILNGVTFYFDPWTGELKRNN